MLKCVEIFKTGPRNVVGDVLSGRPSSIMCIEVNKQLDQSILGNRRISTDKIEYEVSHSHGTKLCSNGLRPIRKHFIQMKENKFVDCLIELIKSSCLHGSKTA